uniref:F-box/LRR-repeat protein n=1 Tax=Strongyloides venezuelensis TaxID=75913 RepID=A0A0K0F270_STRVS
MQKPKLNIIFFENDYNCNYVFDRIKITYDIDSSIMDSPGNIELDQLHSFLKKVDLTSLSCMNISLNKHTDARKIFGDYIHRNQRIHVVHVIATNCEKDLGNTLSFLQKVEHVEYLELKLHFQNVNVPRDFVIPLMDSLKSKVYVKEEVQLLLTQK